MFDDSVVPYDPRHFEKLEEWRKNFDAGTLTVNHGYENRGLETVVALNGRRELLGSLTAMMIVALDPLIRKPDATPGEMLVALHAMCRHLECNAKVAGAIESMIAVPNTLPKYQRVVEKCGFVETAPDCKIYRRVL